MTKVSTPISGRRGFITAVCGALAAPYVWSRRANAAQQVVVRTSGGEADEARRAAVWEPFRKETGIEVVPVPGSSAQILASVKSGHVQIDINDNDTLTLAELARAGALEPIDYKSFKYADLDDIEPALKRQYDVGQGTYATILGYNTEIIPVGKAPQSWAEFWDLKAFPGPRSLADMTDYCNLEFALLADGVPMDKLYPLDLNRAFASLSRIRPAVPKFWASGAMSVEMLTDKEVNMGSIWSTRFLFAKAKGAPIAAQWNQNRVAVQAFGVIKNAPNLGNAMKFIDFALQPGVQAKMLKALPFVPSHGKLYASLPADLIDPATGTPWTVSRGFIANVDWWAENDRAASEAWSKWVQT
jgi:putative spermidine/putrescine transport system substrate-binding protein